MKNQSSRLLIIGILQAVIIIIISAFNYFINAKPVKGSLMSTTNEKLKKEAFSILETKCNSCHRKQNPFMIFKEKNMSKKAPKIYQMVFIEERMPKGNDVKLSNKEYEKLKEWLFTEDIF